MYIFTPHACRSVNILRNFYKGIKLYLKVYSTSKKFDEFLFEFGKCHSKTKLQLPWTALYKENIRMTTWQFSNMKLNFFSANWKVWMIKKGTTSVEVGCNYFSFEGEFFTFAHTHGKFLIIYHDATPRPFCSSILIL